MAVFTTVTSGIQSEGNKGVGDVVFALFLLFVLSIASTMLLSLLIFAVVSDQHCSVGGCQMNTGGRWTLALHAATIVPLVTGAAYWFWRRSHAGVAQRFGIQ